MSSNIHRIGSGRLLERTDGAPLDAVPDPDLDGADPARVYTNDPHGLRRMLDREYQAGFDAAMLCIALLLVTIAVVASAWRYVYG